MTLSAGPTGNLRRQHASQVAALAAVTIAAAAFIGWWVSPPLPSSWGVGFATVKPTTALCVAALGLALARHDADSPFTFAVGLAVATIGAVDTLDLFGIDSGSNRLNRLLVPHAAMPGPETSFRIINGVPVALILVGSSLAISRFGRYRFAATALAGIAGVMVTFALLNYLTGSRMFYGALAAPTPLTTVGLLCVVGAIILRIGTMPALRKPRPLWHLLIVLGCATITPLLLFGVYMGVRITDAENRDVRDHLMSQARSFSATVDREIIGEIERLQALAASPSLRQDDFAEFQRQAEASLALLQRGNIVLIDRNMRQLVNTFVAFGKPLPKAVAPQGIERTFATGRPQVTGLFLAPVVDQFMFGITVPVEIGGESRYVLGRSQDQHSLTRLIAENELPVGWLAVVTDATHHIMARSEREDGFIGKQLHRVQWRRAGPSGVFEFVDAEGRQSLEAYVRSELTGWQTVVWAPAALLEARIRTLWWGIGTASLLAFVLVFGFALWLGRIVARSVGQAARATIALKKGGPLPLTETPVAEVETLMGELRQTAVELRETAARQQEAESSLHESKDRLELALDAAQLGWWRYDPRLHVASWDPRAKEILDIAQDETELGELLKRVHPDDVENFWAVRGVALNPADPKPYANEYRVRRRNGEVRWVESRGLAYFEGAGPKRSLVNFTGTVQDITERREREEKEHLLMREINHRSKNMLSVVGAIAHQTAAKNPEEFIRRFSERIQALSANQDLLVRNEWKGVDIGDLVHAQLAHFTDLIGSRIAAQGSKLRLNPASVQAIGLALHELSTNAAKYGALSTDRGHVDISWGSDGDTLTMSWIELDGPVSPPQQRGFGTVVMKEMVERTVGGEIEVDYAPSGVTWRLTCPAANVLERR